MTMQIPDIYIYKGNEFEIIAFQDNCELNLEELGLEPVMNSTDCVRGYTATYTFDSGNFKLIELIVSQEKEFPVINNVIPEEYYENYDDIEFDFIELDEFDEMENVYQDYEESNYINVDNDYCPIKVKIYKNLNLLINYTGSILIGRNYMTNKYSRFFKEPYGYSEVYEVAFNAGSLTEIKYRTKDMRKVRTTINRLGRKKVLEEIGLDKFIKEIFNLDYDILLD